MDSLCFQSLQMSHSVLQVHTSGRPTGVDLIHQGCYLDFGNASMPPAVSRPPPPNIAQRSPIPLLPLKEICRFAFVYSNGRAALRYSR